MTDRSTHEHPADTRQGEQTHSTFSRTGPHAAPMAAEFGQIRQSQLQQGQAAVQDKPTLRSILIDELHRLSLKYATNTDECAMLRSAVMVVSEDRQMHLDAQVAESRALERLRLARTEERTAATAAIDALEAAHAQEIAVLEGKIILARLALAD